MNYLKLVNRDNLLDKTYIPDNLVDSKSSYRNGIMVSSIVSRMFTLMKLEAIRNGYDIDIMSGYRTYQYQNILYNNLVKEKGLNYTFRHIAPPGASEHQLGLAIDICVYHNDKCYTEHDITYFDEIKWLHKNAHKYGFILRYPNDKEEITGYIYEPWHFRYVGNMASYMYFNNIVLEELSTCKNI